MPDQITIGAAYARNTDPETSHQAAKVVAEEQANELEAQVLAAIKSHPQGLTNHEIVQITGLSWNTSSPRIRPLCRKNLVRDSGERRKGPGTNRRCIVWVAVVPGPEQGMLL
jgi:uncharacterized membrane protein